MSKYIIDPTNTEISFYVSYLVIAKVKGDIKSFSGNIESELEDLTDSQIELNIDTNSIYTGIKDRDDHLKSDDFLDTNQFPHIKFVSTSIEKKKVNYSIKGILRIKNVSKEVEFTATKTQDNFFNIRGEISREDYNLRFNSTNKGNHLVGNEVKIFINCELNKKY